MVGKTSIGLIGSAKNSTIKDCTVDMKVEINGKVEDYNIGAIAGEAIDCEIIDCEGKVEIIQTNELVFGKLEDAIEKGVLDTQQKKELLELVDLMSKTKGTDKFKGYVIRFIEVAANLVTIFSPFIPILMKMS